MLGIFSFERAIGSIKHGFSAQRILVRTLKDLMLPMGARTVQDVKSGCVYIYIAIAIAIAIDMYI